MQVASPKATRRQSRSHRKQPSGPFTCHTCGKVFTRVENLTRHAENHKTTAKFVCHVCQRRFTRSDLLKRHSKIHDKNAGRQYLSDAPLPDPAGNLHFDNADERLQQTQPRAEDMDESHMHMVLRSSDARPAHPFDTRYQEAFHATHGTTRDFEVSRGLIGSRDQGQDYRASLDPNPYPSSTSITQSSPNSDPPWPYASYGMYGEGCLDTDLAWILDIGLVDYPSPNDHHLNLDSVQTQDYPNRHSERSPPGIVSIGGETASRHRGGQACDYPTDDDQNDWPDEDPVPGAPAPSEIPPTDIPSQESWVEPGEIRVFQNRFKNANRQFLRVTPDVRARLLATLADSASIEHGHLPPDESKFPVPEVLEYFLSLFFEFVHPRFPVLHKPTFNTAGAPPYLLLAMMLLGSSHSRSNRGKLVAVYLHLATTMFMRLHALKPSFPSSSLADLLLPQLRSVANILTLLFLCVSGAWSGHKSAFEFAEGARGILVTACRRCRLLDCRPKPLVTDAGATRPMRVKLLDTWMAWIELEQRKRLGLAIHMFDLQFPALFHNQPYISKGETVNLVLPCEAAFWEAKSPEAWKVLLGPAEIPSAMYFMVPLDTCLLYPELKRDPPYAPIDSYSKIILISALFGHIFEWRQNMNIVLHSAFIRAPESIGPAEGLADRQRWLRNGLKAWLDNYHHSNVRGNVSQAPPAGLLLHHLANIYLDINISDLHLYAGRSGLNEDIQLAEDALRRWCQSSGSKRTIERVHEMLDLARRTIEDEMAATCGFEVSVALLTGGLICWMYDRLGGEGPSGDWVRY
ncbi:hypothetical protein IFM58399_05887 [Aspergillus lentulus]|uniref:C2H2 finger domain transcription factor n=1 Tax=Aspergillus lentulus TaxID=293939 RepID=UPI001392EF15|nr:uncharacterized protein IFM58399_05887 [Aspergillus lentulus]GFF40321.1 hypothetical protein IFM58399_05887 [Aspergillus lentulus]